MGELTYLFIYILLCALLALVIFWASYLVIPVERSQEKVSAYECGFYPFGDARAAFDIKFYLVAILFIIFDLELAYLFPWVTVLGELDLLALYVMLFFFALLAVGFIYEWRTGALEW
jgi:NADH-quinone oxidoreductase subunit A